VHTATTAKKRPPHPLRLPLPFTCQTPNDPTAPRSSPLPHLLPASLSPTRPENRAATTSAQSSTKRDPTARNFFSFTRGKDRSSSPHQSALIFIRILRDIG
ncbi:hypothetical protein AABB24_039561, partial [Solanum stoloniferum]